MTSTDVDACLYGALEATFAAHLRTVCTRTGAALAQSGYRGLLIHSGAPVRIFEDDQDYPFRVNAPFKVFAPLTDAPDSFVYFEPEARPLLLLHRPRDFWHKAAELTDSYWTRHFDIREITHRAEARAHLPGRLSAVAFIGDPLPELVGWGVEAVNPRALMQRLDYPRAAKTPYELECLREASRRGARGHRAAARAFAAGASEFEIAMAFMAGCGQRERELPYNPIVALNDHAATLHYQVLELQGPRERCTLLIDAGAEFAGYASDITRTYSGGDADFAALIERMDRMQLALCAAVRAGVDWRVVQLRAHALTGEVLKDADLIRCGAEEAVATGVTGVFLPHGIGHLLGLEVHDVGGLMASPEGGEIPRPNGHPFLRLTRTLEPGFVVTMEPGIYFIDALLDAARADRRGQYINWPRVEALRKFGGIRIEDDLVIAPDGCENLTREAFRAVN